MKTGIIDVGGGLRGIYAAGVLDHCMDQGIHFDCCIGVSAGSANMISYMAGQRGRNYHFYTEYAFRKEYMGAGNYLHGGGYINMDYIYGTLSNANGENPLDYNSFRENPAQFLAVAAEAISGRVKYFDKDDVAQDDYQVLCASCCIPGVNPPYEIDGVAYFDGALADPVPVQKALDEGCDRIVLLLTKPLETVRTPKKDIILARTIRRRYPMAAYQLSKRAGRYNAGVDLAKKLQEQGKALILAPDDITGVDTLTKNKGALCRLYDKGYQDGEKISEWFNAGDR